MDAGLPALAVAVCDLHQRSLRSGAWPALAGRARRHRLAPGSWMRSAGRILTNQQVPLADVQTRFELASLNRTTWPHSIRLSSRSGGEICPYSPGADGE